MWAAFIDACPTVSQASWMRLWDTHSVKCAAIALVVVGMACAASSEPRTREVPAPPRPAPTAPLDAPSQLPVNADATESVPTDAPARVEVKLMVLWTVYPIIELKPLLAGGSQVVIQIGSNLGVNKSWKANLVDKEGNPIPRGELTIEFVRDEVTRATSKLPVEKIPRDVQAKVRPL
jgi:hypothetical protein